ncbi:MAG: acetate--CoA ligase family protein [Rhodobacter sp.]|nr:acetate--CoA ligase family protein [Rhodobacter sp.]
MRDLSRLLRPRSIACIGGGAEARYLIENCAKIGFEGPVWHVHPTKGDFGAVAELPHAPDAAFVGVNRAATLGIVAGLAAIRAGGAVAYASGFREAEAELGDGGLLQARLLEAAGPMPLIGPNCYGFLNYLDGAALWPDQQGGRRVETGVAIITQSSNIAINLTMQRRGLPLAYVVTAGNQAQVGLADLGRAVLDDPRVTALGLHIEGIGDLRGFEALAAAAQGLGKPVVALKAGRSEQARAAAVSHTASLAGSGAGADALFRRLAIAQVRSLSELLETLKLLHVTGPLGSNRIASMSCSGGEASLMADGAAGRDLVFPALEARQRDALRAALGPKVALANPLDYHTYIWADADRMSETFAAMMQGDRAIGAVIADFPRADRCSDADWEPVIAATHAAAAASGRPMAIVSTLPDTLPEATAERLTGLGIAAMAGLDDALAAIEAAAFLGRAPDPQEPLLLATPPRNVRLLAEAEGKAALAGFGVAVPQACRCMDRGALALAAQDLAPPVVLKIDGVAHKTDVGGVALNLASPAAVAEAASAMPDGPWLIEEMVTGGVAELLIGVLLDPAHGYVLTIGAGGTLTELLADARSLLLPAAEADIRAALAGLRIAPLLQGFRGAPAADIDAIVRTVLAVQRYVAANRSLVEEVEINPLICTDRAAVAADVLIRIGERDA